jgi:hypothetical protein
LVKKRLKEVVVATVDQRDANWRSGESMNGLEPAESGADYDHMMTAHCLSAPTLNVIVGEWQAYIASVFVLYNIGLLA